MQNSLNVPTLYKQLTKYQGNIETKVYDMNSIHKGERVKKHVKELKYVPKKKLKYNGK